MKKEINRGEMEAKFAIAFIAMGVSKIAGWSLTLGGIGNFLWLLFRYETLFPWTYLGYPLIAYIGALLIGGVTAMHIKGVMDDMDEDIDESLIKFNKNNEQEKEDNESNEEAEVKVK